MTSDRTPSARTSLELGVLSSRLGARIRLLSSALEQKAAAALAPYGLRPGAFTCMALVSANPGCSQVDVARVGALEKTALVATVDQLEREGLAIRERSPGDRRRNALFLTPAGEALLKEMAGAPDSSERVLRATLSNEEFDALSDLLTRLVETVRAPRPTQED